MNRTRVLLLLIVVLLLAIWYGWKETPRSQRQESGTKSTKSKAIRRAVVTDATALDFTGDNKTLYKKPKRDIFRPLYRAPVAAKKDDRPKPVSMPVVNLPTPIVPPAIVLPVNRAPVGIKPIPPLKVLGFLRKGPKITAFLSSRQGDVYLVKKGDRFADGIIVQELDESKLVVSRGTQGPGTTIVIRERKKQIMQFSDVPSGRPPVPAFSIPESIPTPKAISPVDQTEEEESKQ